MRWRVRGVAAAAVVAVWPSLVAGQQPLRFTARASIAAVRVRSALGSLVEPLSGPALAFGATAARGPWLAQIRYGEGHLTSDDPAVERRTLVDGELLLGLHAGPIVTVKVGPRARAYAAPSGTRRWVFLEARIRADAPLIPSRLEAHAELGGAVLGHTSLATSFGGERGGEVGARWRIPGAPLALTLAYRIDRGNGRYPTSTDTVEQILFGGRVEGIR